MPISVRAKQFLPFAAVKGLSEALEKKEKQFVLKIDISEEQILELNQKIGLIQKGVTVKVTYFCKNDYIQLMGIVTQIDPIYYFLQIDDTVIKFEDILDFELVKCENSHI